MSFRVSNEQTLGEVVKALIESYRMGGKLKEASLINAWESVVGEMIAKHTVQLRINKKVLYVEVDSAALRNELTYAREKLKKALNRKVKDNVIDEVVIR
jgi:predicted nucleic acid-binding Zn ribbon protein